VLIAGKFLPTDAQKDARDASSKNQRKAMDGYTKEFAL
jgi:hypothetical protein